MRALLLAALLLAGSAHAGPLEQAAVNALRDARTQPNGERWEYSGVIVMRDGMYQHPMFPRTDGKIDRVGYSPEQFIKPGDYLLALYHTHPCYRGYWSQYFSRADLVAPMFYHVPAFVLDACTGAVHVFDWRHDKPDATGVDVVVDAGGKNRKVHLTAGRLVGNIGIRSRKLDE